MAKDLKADFEKSFSGYHKDAPAHLKNEREKLKVKDVSEPMHQAMNKTMKRGIARYGGGANEKKMREVDAAPHPIVPIPKPVAPAPQPNTELGQMPSYKKGGVVKKTGPALVHKGEKIIPKTRGTSDGYMCSGKR